jgi:hypothetical protein
MTAIDVSDFVLNILLKQGNLFSISQKGVPQHFLFFYGQYCIEFPDLFVDVLSVSIGMGGRRNHYHLVAILL